MLRHALPLQVTDEGVGAVHRAWRLEDGFLEGTITRDAGDGVGDDDGERVHKINVVRRRDGLHLARRTIGEAAVAHALPVSVLGATLAVEGAHLGLDSTTLVLELVVDRLLEGLVSEAEVVGLCHLHEPVVLVRAQEVGRHS